jgi:hypothetical protein
MSQYLFLAICYSGYEIKIDEMDNVYRICGGRK